MRKPLDLNDARTFVAAAQAGTLSGAARDLQVPTSTVSRSLTRLEERLGLLLVRRSQRGLSLTDPGKEYLLSCKRALQSLREGDDLLEKHRAEPAGVLRVECPVTMARDVLAPLLGKFPSGLSLSGATHSASFAPAAVQFQGRTAHRSASLKGR